MIADPVLAIWSSFAVGCLYSALSYAARKALGLA